MKRTVMLVLVLASVFSLFTATGSTQSTPSDEQARALALNAVTNATGIPKADLNTKRLEEREDDFFLFQTKISGQIRKGAYFYRVEREGWHIISPSEVTYTTNSSQVWYVAISTVDGEAFGLLGFKDADAAFQRLVEKIPVQVKNASEAQVFMRFYLGAVYGNAGNVVYDELRLRHNVEEHFVGYADSQEPLARKEQRYRAWWSGFKAGKARPLAPSAKAEGNGRYRVLVRILGMTVGRPPELSEWSVQVQSNGSCEVQSKKSIYPVVIHSLDNLNVRP